MAKIFKENFQPLEIVLETKDGRQFQAQSLLLTSGDVKKLELIGKGKLKKYKTESDKVFDMMIMSFGKDEKFWSMFSMELLNDVLNSVIEESKKKAKTQAG